MKTLLNFFLLLIILAVSQQASADKRSDILATATSQIGVVEVGAPNHGPEVSQYLASTGLNQGHAWCAAFVNWVYIENNIATPRNAAWSPSWFPIVRLTDMPKPADLFGLYYQNKGRIAHVGIIYQYGDIYCITIEGNTNMAGSREGDGVYKKRRLTRQVSKFSNWIDKAHGNG